MAKNTKQIALIQHRRGKLSELPKQLNEGEFGLALDTNEVFIGNSTNPALAERIESNTFPYGNIQILTEFTDNLQKITYRYKSNTDVKAHLPIVVKGTTASPVISPNTSIIINGTEILFTGESTIDFEEIIKVINSQLGPTTKAFTDDGSYISFITTENALTLEDGLTSGEGDMGNVAALGFGEGSFTEVSALPPERTLQERLDDTVSIKSYGALGDGLTDDGDAIFNSIVSLNKAGVDAKYYRTLFIPAGTYLTSKVIPLPYGTHLKGEGIKRTIIKSKDLSTALMLPMDSNMNLPASLDFDTYCYDAEPAKYITIEDMTIDVSDTSSSSIVNLYACKNVVFKNVEFIGSSATTLIIIKDGKNVSDSLHICFDSCIFNTADYGIKCDSNLEHLVVKNCIFEGIYRNAIALIPFYSEENPGDNKYIYNSIIEGNYFRNCGRTSAQDEPIISLGKNTRYISTVNNRFDEENSTFSAEKSYETFSDLNYTDILDPTTDKRKLLQFNFTQPEWAYVDYLLNPNGEYILNSQYNTQTIDGEEVITPITNGLVFNPGDSLNDNTFTIKSSSNGNLSITSGLYGHIILGDSEGVDYYEDWERSELYTEGRIVQVVEGNYYSVYECIKNVTQEDINIGKDVEPHEDSPYWNLIGVFNPVIMVKKPIDLSGNYISDSKSEKIQFKTLNNNYLEIDDSSSSSDYSYAERIAVNKDAIPNVDYVNTIAQTTIRKKFNYTSIQNYGTNKQEIVYFDPKIYGGFINMNFINVNIRRPFYPVLSEIESAQEWQSGLRYYAGDVIQTFVDDVNVSNFVMKLDIGDEWQDKPSESIYKPAADKIDGNGLPYQDYPDDYTNDIYAVYVDNSERNIFYKKNNRWYLVGSSDWKDLYPSYVEIENASGDYRINSKIRMLVGYVYDEESETYIKKEYTINLSSEPSLENFKNDIMAALPEDSGIKITINGTRLRIEQENYNMGQLVIYNYQYDALEEIGFELDVDGTVKVNTVEFFKTYDSITTFNPEDYIDGSVWIKAQGISDYFVCVYDNIASQTFNQDLGGDGSLSKWVEIETKDKEGNDLKDLKYLSILAQSNDTVSGLGDNEQRLLFLKNIIEADRRDFHSIYEDEFEVAKEYSKGDRCLYKGRYWECLEDYESQSEYDLHNPDLWMAVPEEGFNYHFDFERDIYTIDENDNIVTSDNTVLDYNFADYHLYLMYYDAEGKRLVPYPVDYDLTGLTKRGTISDPDELPTQGVEVNDYFVVEISPTEKEIYVWNGTEWEILEPVTNLCVSPSGNITVTINYLRGQGDDWDEN